MIDVFIYDFLRTPRGRAEGALYEVKPIDLLSTILRELIQRQPLDTQHIEDLLVGCVTPVGDQGGNLPRAALLHAGWAESVTGLQLNRFCGSGLEAVNLGAMKIRSGWGDLVVAGGIESTSRVPSGSDGGAMIFDPEIIQSTNYLPQGIAADLLATIAGFERAQLDAFALKTRERANTALEKGYFSGAIVSIHDHNGLELLASDQPPEPTLSEDQIEALPPAFAEAGALGFGEKALLRHPMIERIRHVHTAANSASAVDGAGILLLGNQERGEKLDLKPRARILGATTLGVDPTLMLNGPTSAAKRVLAQAGLKKTEIDLWECHESFAATVLYFKNEMGIPDKKLNVNGGAITFGNPFGASGAIQLGGLLDELERRDLKRGLVTMSVGGGMAIATVIERV